DGLLQAALHAISNDIQESQDAHFGGVDGLQLFLQKGIGARGAGIHDGGDARLQSQIRRNSQWRFVRSRLGREPVQRSSAVADVVVNVNQARGDVQSGSIHDFAGLRGRNIFVEGGNLAVRDRNIHDAVKPVGRIDDVSALEQQVVMSRLRERWWL